MKYIVTLILLFCPFFLVLPSSAGIYKYVDEKGVIHFTNCPRDPKFKLYIRRAKKMLGMKTNPSLYPT